MLLLGLLMVLILVVAGIVVVYVAFPHRGEEVPGAPWLGEAMKRGVDSVNDLLDLPTDDDLDGRSPAGTHDRSRQPRRDHADR